MCASRLVEVVDFTRSLVLVLPLIAPPGADGETDWLWRALLTIRRDGKPLKPDVIERLATLLAPGPRRGDGLPAYWPAPPNVGQTQAWAALRQRDESPGRAILTAVAGDLQGHSLNHISGALLQLHDHETRDEDVVRQDGVPVGAGRYRKIGRALLAVLGAWPWAHAPEGRLPAGWHSSADHLNPQWVWHAAAVAEFQAEAARVAR